MIIVSFGHDDLDDLDDLIWRSTFQMFLHREEAARRAEEDDDEEDGGDKKEEAGVDGKDTTSEGSKTSGGGVGQTMDPDASGMWQESEAGLEWVVIPVDEKQQDSDVELEVEFPNSQDEEEERFTKGERVQYPFWPLSMDHPVLMHGLSITQSHVKVPLSQHYTRSCEGTFISALHKVMWWYLYQCVTQGHVTVPLSMCYTRSCDDTFISA